MMRNEARRWVHSAYCAFLRRLCHWFNPVCIWCKLQTTQKVGLVTRGHPVSTYYSLEGPQWWNLWVAKQWNEVNWTKTQKKSSGSSLCSKRQVVKRKTNTLINPRIKQQKEWPSLAKIKWRKKNKAEFIGSLNVKGPSCRLNKEGTKTRVNSPRPLPMFVLVRKHEGKASRGN